MGKRLEKARLAWIRSDATLAEEAHTTTAIRAKEPHQTGSGKYIAEAVYGGIDGIVTTFAVVAGVAGASLSPSIVMVLGLANLFADGLSMGAGSYLGARSEADYHRQERLRETWEIEHFPEGEREEIREIYREKGFEGDLLEQVVDVVTADKERWVTTMMVEELGIIEERKDPVRVGITTFTSFAIAGAIPLIAYLGALNIPALSQNSFMVAVVVTMVTIFGLGSARSLVIYKKWWRAGLEMLGVGGLTAVVAYGIGALLSALGVGG